MLDYMYSDILTEELDAKKVEQFMNNVKIIYELSKNHPNIDILKSYKGFGGLKKCFNSKKLYWSLMSSIRTIFDESLENQVFTTLNSMIQFLI